MKAQTLAITGQNLQNNQPFQMVITASNEFMLALKYQNINRDFYIESWHLVNNKWEAGNNGLNAGVSKS
jgi:hypothetical protein